MKALKTEAFSRMKDIYWDWHIEKIGFKPVFDSSDGAGLKKMVDYLFTLSDHKKVDEVVAMFELILIRWDELDEFYKKNTRLRQINGNIHNIIHFFKNGKNSSGVSQDYLERVVNEMRNSQPGD
jgi:hypothetical protein